MASSAQQKAFIEQIAYIIRDEARRRGYKVCSPIIAQACIESAYGTSSLGYRWHNYFGMKCGSKWTGRSVNLSTKEEYGGQLVGIRDNFRVYDDMESGVAGYFDFISTTRYANLKNASTAEEYLTLIKKDGYATSSSYVNTNMNCVRRHDLTKYDWYNNPYALTSTLMIVGSRGESVKWLQFELNRYGSNLVVDGIYGKKTEMAVINYQSAHKLVTDGKAGPVTILSIKKEAGA